MFGSTENGLYFVFTSCFLWAPPPKNLFGFVFCSQYLKCGYENKIWEQLFNIFGFRKMSSVAYFSKTQLKSAHQQIFFFFIRYKLQIYLSDSHPDFIFPFLLHTTKTHQANIQLFEIFCLLWVMIFECVLLILDHC